MMRQAISALCASKPSSSPVSRYGRLISEGCRPQGVRSPSSGTMMPSISIICCPCGGLVTASPAALSINRSVWLAYSR